MRNGRRAVLFDLDGTLVDSVPDLCAAVNEVLGKFRRPPLSETEIRSYVGDGAQMLLARAFSRSLDADPATAVVARAWVAFMAAYDAHLCVHSRLYPGVAETLSQLQEAGALLGIVTNKPTRFIDPLLKRLGVSDCFGAMVGGDTLAQRKPDPAPVLEAMAQLGMTGGERAVMVGDSLNDVRAGRAAGCVVIGVSYGYNQGADLVQAGAIAVIDQMAELIPRLDTLDGT
jgi:phosphoglycolate phosphatase